MRFRIVLFDLDGTLIDSGPIILASMQHAVRTVLGREIPPDEATLHKLKTGCLFAASVGMALWAADVPERAQGPLRAFGDELGLLFQIVDDILDGDGYVVTHGEEGARALADEAAERAQARLDEIDGDTSVLAEIVSGLATRTT